MADRQHDRRKTPSDMRVRPPASPANHLILVVIGVLVISALAAALFGAGTEETTPHGQILTSLQRVAEAQEEHYRRTGEFAGSLEALDMGSAGKVRLGLVRGDRAGWEAVASHPVGLTCLQEGEARQGRPHRDVPVCYRTGSP